jgi:polyisoprenoid-binding protein YceI
MLRALSSGPGGTAPAWSVSSTGREMVRQLYLVNQTSLLSVLVTDRSLQKPAGPRTGHQARGAIGWLTRQAKEMAVTTTTPGIQPRPGGQPRLAAGSWRLDPAQSHASFTAWFAGRPVRGRLPLTGGVLITEPIEDSTARLAARTNAVSTGSTVLDRLLTGPDFLDAGSFPEITFRSERLAWVPAGWRAAGRLQVKNAEHELACQLDLQVGDPQAGDGPRIIVTSSWVIDSRWVTSHWIPALSRRIVMTCSSSLEPGM